MITEKQKRVIEHYQQRQKHSALLEIIQSLNDRNDKLETINKELAGELKKEKMLRWSAEHRNNTKTNNHPEIDLGDDEL